MTDVLKRRVSSHAGISELFSSTEATLNSVKRRDFLYNHDPRY